MLGVVILNIIGIGCAVYFLSLLINGQQRHLQIAGNSDFAQKQDLEVHNREFDALMDMQAKSAAALATMAASLTPPPSAPVSQQQPSRAAKSPMMFGRRKGWEWWMLWVLVVAAAMMSVSIYLR